VPKATKILVALVFGVLFGGVGAAASWIMAKTIYDAKRAESWVQVDARVDAWKSGTVSYRYTFNGTEYKGDRVGAFILGGRDNLDDWYSDMNRTLSRARDRHEPITVYVNPQDPRESMIDRTLRWKLMAMLVPFAVGFGGVGLGALWVILTTLFSREAEPSAWVPGGAVPASAPRRSSGLGGQWAMTIMWNAIAFPIAFIALPPIWESGQWIGLIVAIFPLIGLLLLWGAISSTISAVAGSLRSSRREGVDMSALAQAAKAAPPRPKDSPGATVFARGMLSENGSVPSPAVTPAMVTQSSVAAMALDPDAPPPAVAQAPATDAELARFEQLLKQGKLDANARAQLAKLPPGARKLVMAVLMGGSWLPKIVYVIIGLVILTQVGPVIISLIRSFL
jgi:hypothetical protein